jgi:hypothetical protein
MEELIVAYWILLGNTEKSMAIYKDKKRCKRPETFYIVVKISSKN